MAWGGVPGGVHEGLYGELHGPEPTVMVRENAVSRLDRLGAERTMAWILWNRAHGEHWGALKGLRPTCARMCGAIKRAHAIVVRSITSSRARLSPKPSSPGVDEYERMHACMRPVSAGLTVLGAVLGACHRGWRPPPLFSRPWVPGGGM